MSVHLHGSRLLLCALCTLAAPTAAAPALPHIFFVVVDDLGWGNVGFHRDPLQPDESVQTPHIDQLVRQGIELNRHYVHPTCTPSRASFQSGRLPVHVLQNLTHPCDEHGAIPRNMTVIAAVLKRAGYATHQVGKWDVGMATPTHTPKGRGYDTSLNYFGHANWMYSSAEWLGSEENRYDAPEPGIIDLWDTDRPARDLNGTGYEEYLFRDRMLKILREHDQSKPLFLQYDSKLVHYPLQVPLDYQERFSFIQQDNKRIYQAMVAFLDDQLANITGTMKELGMWDNTLMVLTSDNGVFTRDPQGPCHTSDPEFTRIAINVDAGHGTMCFNGEAGGSNFPLRGGKYSNFEGGIRVTAFASGGYVPTAMRGQRLDGMIHIADWYRTLAEGIAGIDPTDTWAANSGLPPIDSIDMWPYLSGQIAESPRHSFLLSDNVVLVNQWKFITGGSFMKQSAWGGPQYPNMSTAADPIDKHSFTCPSSGCLYDVVSDPTETDEISHKHPQVVEWLQKELETRSKTIWSRHHSWERAECDRAVEELYGGFYGPFREVEWPSKRTALRSLNVRRLKLP